MAEFYTLLSEWPELVLDKPEMAVPTEVLREQILSIDGLSRNELREIDLFFLAKDCKNLIALLENNRTTLPYKGLWTKQELQEMIADALEDEFEDDPRFPSFMAQFVREYYERKRQRGYFPEDRLMLRYWHYLEKEGSTFVKKWARLNIDIANTLTAVLCKRQGWAVEEYTYEYDATEIDDTLQKQLKEIAKESDPVKKEQRIDALKWVWIGDETFLESFSLNALYGYLLKTEMQERWTQLDPEQGQECFRQIIDNLRSESTVPAEFTTYMPKNESMAGPQKATSSFNTKSEGNYNKKER